MKTPAPLSLRDSIQNRTSAAFRVSRQSGLSGYIDVFEEPYGQMRSSRISTVAKGDLEIAEPAVEAHNGWFVTGLLLLTGKRMLGLPV